MHKTRKELIILILSKDGYTLYELAMLETDILRQIYYELYNIS